jgi:glutamine amidotransferase
MHVAIVDYGMGNLFSVKHACEHAELLAVVTADKQEIQSARAVILPGVGAFGDAMKALRELDLLALLKDFALTSGKPFWGICLGFQLMMESSSEFGDHEGLGLVGGKVVRLGSEVAGQPYLKVPQVGWNSIHRVEGTPAVPGGSGTFVPLDQIPDGAFMYYVHSYYVVPARIQLVLTTTDYGGTTFCSSLQDGNIFGCQFHPERSGKTGLQMYRNLAAQLLATHGE